MKKSLISLAVLATISATSANAAVIAGLKNTGVDATADGIDDNWLLNGGSAYLGQPLHPAWEVNNGTSSWLTPTPNGAADLDPSADGVYVYTLNFLLTAQQAASASFSGRFSTDNTVDSVQLNGAQIGSGGACCSFANGGLFGAASGFNAGGNALTFTVRNFAQATGNPSGLRVEFLASNVTAAVPEPATWAMLIVGFGMLGAAMRRRVRTAVSYA